MNVALYCPPRLKGFHETHIAGAAGAFDNLVLFIPLLSHVRSCPVRTHLCLTFHRLSYDHNSLLEETSALFSLGQSKTLPQKWWHRHYLVCIIYRRHCVFLRHGNEKPDTQKSEKKVKWCLFQSASQDQSATEQPTMKQATDVKKIFSNNNHHELCSKCIRQCSSY